MQTVAEIINDALELINRRDGKYRERALAAVNRALAYYADRMPWNGLKREETFLANGTAFYTFPARVARIESIGDKTRMGFVQPGRNLLQQYPEHIMNSPGAGAWQWEDMGIVPVIRSPATDTALELETATSESIVVMVSGFLRDTTSSGTALELYEATETVNLGGSAVTTSNAFAEVTKIEKTEVDTENDVYLKYSVDSQPAARIRAQERSPRYRRIRFLGRPNTGDQFLVAYYARPEPVESEDVVLDPAIDYTALLWRVVGDLHWMAEQADAARGGWSKAEERILELQSAEQGLHAGLEQIIPWNTFIDPEDY